VTSGRPFLQATILYKIAAKADEQRLRDMKRLSGGAGGGDAAEAISERAVVPEFVPAEPLHLRSVLPPGYKDTYTDRRNSHFLLRLFREYVAAGHIAIRPGVTFIFDDGLGEPLHVTYERSNAGIPPGMSAALRDEACDLVKSVKSLPVESAYGEADLSLTFWVKYLADNYDIGDVLLETTDSDSLAIFTLFMAKEYMADDIGEEPGTTISTPMFDVWLHSAPISKKTMDGGREMIPQFLNLTQVMREGAAAGRPLRIQVSGGGGGGGGARVQTVSVVSVNRLSCAWRAETTTLFGGTVSASSSCSTHGTRQTIRPSFSLSLSNSSAQPAGSPGPSSCSALTKLRPKSDAAAK
jgi:hypothetical protein